MCLGFANGYIVPKKEDVTQKFNLGDTVVAYNGYRGKIVLIQNGYARVESKTSECAFKLGELKLVEPNETAPFTDVSDNKVIIGDILNSDADIICHQVNCQGVMGAGLARQIKEKYPHIFNHYVWHCKTFKPNLLGTFILDSINEKQVIASLFAQDRYGRDKQYTDYDAFRKCLKAVAFFACPDWKIAIPYKIGCGLGGGDWKIVEGIIEEELASYNVEFWKLPSETGQKHSKE